jgi:tetratricopeptide (TPR) repeat protein
VRCFNQDTLRALTEQSDVIEAYAELRRFPFVRPRADGLMLHDAVRELMDEYLRMHAPDRYHELHSRAANYYGRQMARHSGEEVKRDAREQLYHLIHADEAAGVHRFQQMAEELTRYRWVSDLRALLADVLTYSNHLAYDDSRLWVDYYSARLLYLESRPGEAEKAYQALSESPHADSKLRAYALCDWGDILARNSRYGQVQDSLSKVVEQSMESGAMDAHLCQNYFSLARAALYEGRWEQATKHLQAARDFFDSQSDNYGMAFTLIELRENCAFRGQWKDMFILHQQAQAVLSRIIPEPLALSGKLLSGWTRAWALAGRMAESEERARKALATVRCLEDRKATVECLRDLGWILAFEDKLDEAQAFLSEDLALAQSLGKAFTTSQATALSFLSMIQYRRGRFNEAKELLEQSLHLRDAAGDSLIRPRMESIYWLGVIAETQHNWAEALSNYQSSAECEGHGLYYAQASALTGVVRVSYELNKNETIASAFRDAEQLAQTYEYDDHLASFRLTQGHSAWDGQMPEWRSGFESAFAYYQHALIYALRYNRFLLDEVLSGRPQGTPLQPIIPYCLNRGEEGRTMLARLRDWWSTGTNDVGAARPDTISPIPEGISLLEAERMARRREPGDGSPQTNVLDRFDAALAV